MFSNTFTNSLESMSATITRTELTGDNFSNEAIDPIELMASTESCAVAATTLEGMSALLSIESINAFGTGTLQFKMARSSSDTVP